MKKRIKQGANTNSRIPNSVLENQSINNLIKGKVIIFVMDEKELERSASLRRTLREHETDPKSRTLPYHCFFDGHSFDDADMIIIKGSNILKDEGGRHFIRDKLEYLREEQPDTAILIHINHFEQFACCADMFPKPVHVLQFSTDADNMILLRTAAETNQKLIENIHNSLE